VIRTLSFLALLGLAVSIGPARSEDAPAKTQPPGTSTQTGVKQTYLGMEVEFVPSALSSQMPGILPKGQGVMILHVTKDSPAAKAGLQRDDVLLSYGDQKISSPEQLVKMVRNDKPGHEIALNFVRGGKSENCKIMLGEREVPNAGEKPHVFRFRPDERFQQIFEESEARTGGSAWESFDALKLTRLDANRWRAEIEYRSKEGKKERKAFEGTRAEIRKMVQEEKDMPANEQGHLLRTLNLHPPVFEFYFPHFDQIGPPFKDHP